MTREHKTKVLTWYCEHCGSTCDKCEISTCITADCDFDNMSDVQLDKIYDYYKELNLPDYDNSENLSKIESHMTICHKLNSIYQAKNHDYGDSFGETFEKLGIISAVTRLSDKMNRLVSLVTTNERKVEDEKIEDTLMDMANYAIMTLIELGYTDNVKKVVTNAES